jgi:hypothetical protein
MATRDDDDFAPFDRLVDGSYDRPSELAGVRARAVDLRARAVDLIESMDPIRLPLGRKQRLLLSLGRGEVRPRTMWLRPVVVGAVLMGSGAIASAAFTGWPTRLVRSLETLVSPRADSRSAPRLPALYQGLTIQATPAVESVPSTTPPPPLVVRRPVVDNRARRPQAEAPSDDPSLLVGATRALRVDRDPELARSLAKRYLERQPRGALADEALAISIEAAIDHHDADAAALSARYLAQFPHGSFRALAERTLAWSQNR